MQRLSGTAIVPTGTLLLRTNQDVVVCRRTVGQLADALHFSVIARTMLVTAASELGRNTVIHGGGGRLVWSVLRAGHQTGVRLSFEDYGPGIADLSLALADGWTSTGGLGFGLPGARRLVHEFAIDSTPGKGTRVIVTRWREGPIEDRRRVNAVATQK